MGILTKDTSDSTNRPAAEFRSRVMDGGHQPDQMAQRAGERVGAMAADLASTTGKSLKSSHEYVNENPLKSVAIAAVVGLAAGGLLTTTFLGRRN